MFNTEMFLKINFYLCLIFPKSSTLNFLNDKFTVIGLTDVYHVTCNQINIPLELTLYIANTHTLHQK